MAFQEVRLMFVGKRLHNGKVGSPYWIPMGGRFPQLGVMIAFCAGLAFMAIGCRSLREAREVKNLNTPAKAGLNSRDLIDPMAQTEADEIFRYGNLAGISKEIHDAAVQRANAADPGRMNRPPKNVLCLSGGGSYGAFSAGIIYGWTCSGTRPEFDTVTGISTGSLIAPFAFLGPRYDETMKRFYTDINNNDIYKKRRIIPGLVGEAFADNAPLAKMIAGAITDDLVSEIAEEHRKGRRLYVGTTELEGNQFIIWDIGAIASDQGTAGKTLIRKVLLGSAAIPGFFPSTKIDISIDGKKYAEKHVDGGVGQGIFWRPPSIPAEKLREPNTFPLAGTRTWCIVAGKLYADPLTVKPETLEVAGAAVNDVVFAQTRGDLQRIYIQTLLTGMDYYLTSIPIEFKAPKSATEFASPGMISMFNEGYRLSVEGKAWRRDPPGGRIGETPMIRGGTRLIETPRGPKAGSGIEFPGQ